VAQEVERECEEQEADGLPSTMMADVEMGDDEAGEE